jgi:hypothetical protein
MAERVDYREFFVFNSRPPQNHISTRIFPETVRPRAKMTESHGAVYSLFRNGKGVVFAADQLSELWVHGESL